MHALIHYEDVRVPAENLLGGEGQAFAIAQTRLGGGRVHHAMRTVATCQRALDLLCERVLSRETQGTLLAQKQFIQGDIADSYAELQQFRLLVLYTAWEIDQVKDYRRTRKNIAAIKALTPKVMQKSASRIGSSTVLRAACTTRSRTVAMPSRRYLPPRLGIITSRTASGLNLRALRSSRSSDRKPCSPTTVVMWRAVRPSTPAERAPRLLLTRAQASTRTAGS